MEKTWWKRLRLGLGIAGLVFMPAMSYALFEWVTGNLGKIDTACALVNVALMSGLYLAVFAVSGRSRIAVPVVSLGLFVLSAAEAFVVAFRGRPIMPADFMAFRTAMSVAGNYGYTVSREMILSFLCLAGLNVGLFFCPVRLPWWKIHAGFAAGTAAVLAGSFTWFIHGPVASGRFGINMWDLQSSYETEGYLLSTVIAGTYLVKEKPAGYGDAALEMLYGQWKNGEPGETESTAEPITPTNIICIMNESFSDLEQAGNFETNEEVMPFFHSLEGNAVKGSLYVPVFGAGTSNTEFEFLVGDSMAFMAPGTTAYQFNVRPGEGSLVSTLKEQGYTAVALHPYPKENWNRETCYQNMGFDQFLAWDYFEDCPLTRCYVGDRENYEKMVRLLENKANPSDKLFLFNVTMQNHGGYDEIYDNYEQRIHLTGDLEGKYPMADQFLSLMRTSDDALQWLLEYLEGVEEPTMVVLFGDHQPSVEDEFFYEVSDLERKTVTNQESLIWYETPYLIWTNYPMETEETGDMSAFYLAPELLRMAGLETTPYQNFLLGLKEQLPVIHGRGCYDAEGTYYDLEDAKKDGKLGSWIADYDTLIYNHSYDGPMQKLFHLTGN